MKPETIERYKDRLKVLVIWNIRRVFRERTKVKMNKQGSTSNLKEVSSRLLKEYDEEFTSAFMNVVENISEPEPEPEKDLTHTKRAIKKAMLTQNDGTNNDSDYMKVSILLQSIVEPISEMSRKMGIPRYYLSNLKKQGQELLKQTIQ